MGMERFAWNVEKNGWLVAQRGISFERVVQHIERGDILDVIRHPNVAKYPGQKMFIIDIDDYAYLVPFVESDSEIFLKTIMPSRKATKKYLRS